MNQKKEDKMKNILNIRTSWQSFKKQVKQGEERCQSYENIFIKKNVEYKRRQANNLPK